MAYGDGSKGIKYRKKKLLDEMVESMAGEHRKAYTTTELWEMVGSYDEKLNVKSRKGVINLFSSSDYLVEVSSDSKGGNKYWLVPPITPKDQRLSKETKVALYEKVEALVDSSKNLEASSGGSGSDSQSDQNGERK